VRASELCFPLATSTDRRLSISKAGTTFTRYFPDKKFGGNARQSLAAAEQTLAELKALIAGSKLASLALNVAVASSRRPCPERPAPASIQS
jgi:hypothetical protein